MDIIEKDYYLKYFFLIDSNLILENIEKELQAKTSEHPFHIIFNQINKACHRYTKSIFYHLTNFNHSQKSFSIADIYENLIERTFQYHCILHGFMSNIQDYDIKHNNQIEISGSKDAKLKYGYFETEHFVNDPPSLSNDDVPSGDISQNYNQHKKRFQRQKDGYVYSILRKVSHKPSTDFPTVPKHDGNWACFIYTNSAVATLDRTIRRVNTTQTRALLNNYKTLLDECCFWCNGKFSFTCDQFLFEHAMESIYGFSFFHYAAKLLNKIHISSSDDGHMGYKDLEGTAIQNLIQQTARLPITYNRSIFLEYAVELVVASESLKSQEYEEHGHLLFTNLSYQHPSKDLLFTSGLEHIKEYLQKITYIAIPLFENLWDVLIEKLNRKTVIINTETYKNYIQENYFEMTKNISCLFAQDSDPSKNALENISILYNGYFAKDTRPSIYERESLASLLNKYFDIKRFDNFPPSLVDPLISCAIKEDIGSRPHENANELNYIKGHIATMISYCKHFPSK